MQVFYESIKYYYISIVRLRVLCEFGNRLLMGINSVARGKATKEMALKS
jgi:hypothetical protein